MGEAHGIANLHVKRGWSLAGTEIGTVGSYLAKLPKIKRRKEAKERKKGEKERRKRKKGSHLPPAKFVGCK